MIVSLLCCRKIITLAYGPRFPAFEFMGTYVRSTFHYRTISELQNSSQILRWFLFLVMR